MLNTYNQPIAFQIRFPNHTLLAEEGILIWSSCFLSFLKYQEKAGYIIIMCTCLPIISPFCHGTDSNMAAQPENCSLMTWIGILWTSCVPRLHCFWLYMRCTCTSWSTLQEDNLHRRYFKFMKTVLKSEFCPDTIHYLILANIALATNMNEFQK